MILKFSANLERNLLKGNYNFNLRMKNTSAMTIAILFGYAQSQTTSDLTVDNTLAGCKTFASQFANTCTAVASAAKDIPTASMTCKNVVKCPTHGTTSGENCTFTRKLCVTCRESGGKVYIRTQGNNMPNHCFNSPREAPAETLFDFEARWLAPTDSTRRRELEDAIENDPRQLQVGQPPN